MDQYNYNESWCANIHSHRPKLTYSIVIGLLFVLIFSFDTYLSPSREFELIKAVPTGKENPFFSDPWGSPVCTDRRNSLNWLVNMGSSIMHVRVDAARVDINTFLCEMNNILA